MGNLLSNAPLIIMLALPIVGASMGYYDNNTALMQSLAMGAGYMLMKVVGFAFKVAVVGVLGVGALLLASGTPPTTLVGDVVAFAKEKGGAYLWEDKPGIDNMTTVAKTKIADELHERGITGINDIGRLHFDADGKLTAKPVNPY